jgi:hypothetical protein
VGRFSPASVCNMGEQSLSHAAKKKSQSHYGADVAITGVECERRHVFINSLAAQPSERPEQYRRKRDEQIGSRCLASSANERLRRANG